ncbi:MAG: hypothetical protein LLG06_01160 [Desulfobacteraceae bacterium]|nr:hypothetical protein [Desulfobacteraceae bacterium]
MALAKFRIFFDDRDYRLLDIVNAVSDRRESFTHLNGLLYPQLHPHGIKESAESRGLRIAYAIIHLLGSLDSEKANERLIALRSLRDEVLNSADSHMRKNTARVLLQIMKELVRNRGDRLRQLELAHDFCSAVPGKPRIIRKLLCEHHLLEMPEEWNQVAFDGHVHDSFTKGRKSPTHLIMDAWIKGIRHLTIIHYNYVDPEPVAELLEAAEIMDVNVRVGVEFPARFYDRFIHMIWAPRGFSDAEDFLSFLRLPAIREFMEEGQKLSEYRQERVLAALKEFNERHRPTVNEEFGLDIAPLSRTMFLSSINTGQASILHLARFIYASLFPAMQERLAHLRKAYALAEASEKERIGRLVDRMNVFDSETIVDRFLRPDCRASHSPSAGTRMPGLLELSPEELIGRLQQLHSGARITLNLSGLRCEDVLELLYDCKGAVTHLEIFNSKDQVCGKAPDYSQLNELQDLINSGNTFGLTRRIREIIRRMQADPQSYPAERIRKFQAILEDAVQFISFYKIPLGSIIGSDSTGHSRRAYGMGFAIIDTLPSRAKRKIKAFRKLNPTTIPVSVEAKLRTTFIPRGGRVWDGVALLLGLFTSMPLFNQKKREWQTENSSVRISRSGNIVALGGIRRGCNGFFLKEPAQRTRPNLSSSWRYLNGILKNTIKILAGFVPSVLTFMYTQDWWFLVYLGTPIWFAITGLRNVLQSVFGGGGIRRSPLLRWNSYVSWDRMSDSLLYTGISVPLLEYLIRVLLLEQAFDITTTTNSLMLYSVMSVVNGAYISGHNIIRGLPKEAILGNFFRSILNIPLSIGLDSALGGVLGACGVAGANDILQQWASIISKTSSDCVAGIIEGLADKRNYIRIRVQDYRAKIADLFSTYEKLEVLFPESDVLRMLERDSFPSTNGTPSALQKLQIVNALDLLYFWMYQPRAGIVCISLLKKMTYEELQIFIRSQSVLFRKSEITRLFVTGLVGENWSKALAFYLENHQAYLRALDTIYDRLSTRITILRHLVLSGTEIIRFVASKARRSQHWILIPKRS